VSIKVTLSNVNYEVFMANEVELTFRGSFDEICEAVNDMKLMKEEE